MNLLCFDTTSRRASIAVLRDEEVVAEYNFAANDDLSAMLAPGAEFLLRSLRLKIADIDLFAAATGPGLFTGIRVGLATLEGLNHAAGKPVAGVNTLEALAANFAGAGAGQTVVPMIDARKGEIYLGAYDFTNGGPREKLAPGLLRVEDTVLSLAPFGDVVFVGSGAENHRDLLGRLHPRGRFPQCSAFLAGAVGRIALRRFREGRCLTDMQQLLPYYVRKPDAEMHHARPGCEGD
jgi:tRNA threonylcarbamoyladenosine biosynthesis protein TsaB